MSLFYRQPWEHGKTQKETDPATGRIEGKAEHAGTELQGSDITGFCGRPGRHNANPGAEQPQRHAGGPATAGSVSSCHRLFSLLPAPSQPVPSPSP